MGIQSSTRRRVRAEQKARSAAKVAADRILTEEHEDGGHELTRHRECPVCQCHEDIEEAGRSVDAMLGAARRAGLL